jgi:hypothetical protein
VREQGPELVAMESPMGWGGGLTTRRIQSRAMFSSPQKSKSFQNFLLRQIVRQMHQILNRDENKN